MSRAVAVSEWLGRRRTGPQPSGKVLIAAAEAGGRLHPDLIDFIKRYIKAGCSDDIIMYVYKLKGTMQRISVALRRTTSRALMELERRAKAYPSVALGAVPLP